MNRKGIITTSNITENQCKDKGHYIYYYHVQILFSPNIELDDNGWLIDHNEFDKSIKDAVKIGSCEEMATRIINACRRRCKDNNVPIDGIKLVLNPVLPIPTNGAWFEQYWFKN